MNRVMHRWQPLVGVLAGMLVLSACAGRTTTHEASDVAAASPSKAGATATSSPGLSRPQDPLAPRVMSPVVRAGEPQQGSRLAAAPVGYHAAVVYRDGVRLRVLSIGQGHTTGHGIGVIVGHHTVFSLQLTNRGHHVVDLGQVVVTAVYGEPGRIARPVYDSGEQDFSGLVPSGHSALARYAFAIPVSDLSHVIIHVDFDSRHAAATFRGNAS